VGEADTHHRPLGILPAQARAGKNFTFVPTRPGDFGTRYAAIFEMLLQPGCPPPKAEAFDGGAAVGRQDHRERSQTCGLAA